MIPSRKARESANRADDCAGLDSGCRDQHDMEHPEPQLDDEAMAFLAVEDDDVPATFAQVLKHPDRKEWMDAINSELNAHIERGTFEECPVRPGQRLVNPR